MLNRPTFFLWVSVNIKGRKRFRFAFPVAIPIFIMLFDIVDDFAAIYGMLPLSHRKSKIGRHQLPEYKYIKEAIAAIYNFQYELMFNTGPLDIADIEVGEGEKRVAVKCLLR